MRRIAVLGASGTGKTWLAGQLKQALADATPALHIDDDPALAVSHLRHGAVLLMGLDLCQPLPAQRQADLALRKTLTEQGTPFQVIYGQGQNRLLNALQALQAAEPSIGQPAPQGDTDSNANANAKPKRKPWVWACEKCSDPVCEHRLLSDLLAKR
jgi:hypothetical protein